MAVDGQEVTPLPVAAPTSPSHKDGSNKGGLGHRTSFMDLPGEIRKKVYGHILGEPHSIGIHCPGGADILSRRNGYHDCNFWRYVKAQVDKTSTEDVGPYKREWVISQFGRQSRLEVQLLFVNKQISVEAARCLYSHSKFLFHDPKTLSIFLERMRKEVRIGVTHITIHDCPKPAYVLGGWHRSDMRAALAILGGECTKLECLLVSKDLDATMLGWIEDMLKQLWGKKSIAL